MMALIPVTWENIERMMPMINAVRRPGLNSSAKELVSVLIASSISCNSSFALADPLIFARIFSASSVLPTWASQRGHSGKTCFDQPVWYRNRYTPYLFCECWYRRSLRRSLEHQYRVEMDVWVRHFSIDHFFLPPVVCS